MARSQEEKAVRAFESSLVIAAGRGGREGGKRMGGWGGESKIAEPALAAYLLLHREKSRVDGGDTESIIEGGGKTTKTERNASHEKRGETHSEWKSRASQKKKGEHFSRQGSNGNRYFFPSITQERENAKCQMLGPRRVAAVCDY